MVGNIADFERGYATYDVAAKAQPFVAFKADLVILAIGENVGALTNAAAQTGSGSQVRRACRTVATWSIFTPS